MHIIELKPPPSPGGLWSGVAVSTRGQEWFFCATKSGQLQTVRRNETVPGTQGTLWIDRPAPAALKTFIRRAVRKGR